MLGSGIRFWEAQEVTPERYAACDHIVASKEGDVIEPIDIALEKLGLQRTIRVVVPGYPDAMRIVRQSDLVALAPRSCFVNSLTTDHAATAGLATFEPPVSTPEFKVSAIWHPRMDADPAHRWLHVRVSGSVSPPIILRRGRERHLLWRALVLGRIQYQQPYGVYRAYFAKKVANAREYLLQFSRNCITNSLWGMASNFANELHLQNSDQVLRITRCRGLG